MPFRGFSTISLPRALAPPTPEPRGDSQLPSCSGPCPLTGTPNIHQERILQDSQLPLSWLPAAWASLHPQTGPQSPAPSSAPARPLPAATSQPRCGPALVSCHSSHCPKNRGPEPGSDVGLPTAPPEPASRRRRPLSAPQAQCPDVGLPTAPFLHKVSSRGFALPCPSHNSYSLLFCPPGNVTLILHTRKPGSSYRCLPGVCGSWGPAGLLSRACLRVLAYFLPHVPSRLLFLSLLSPICHRQRVSSHRREQEAPSR